jgi:hypothetical protein
MSSSAVRLQASRRNLIVITVLIACSPSPRTWRLMDGAMWRGNFPTRSAIYQAAPSPPRRVPVRPFARSGPVTPDLWVERRRPMVRRGFIPAG